MTRKRRKQQQARERRKELEGGRLPEVARAVGGIVQPGRLFGKVSATKPERGYGFLLPDTAGAEELFFHATAVQGTTFEALKPGDAVSFEVLQTRKGPRAVHVQREDVGLALSVPMGF